MVASGLPMLEIHYNSQDGQSKKVSITRRLVIGRSGSGPVVDVDLGEDPYVSRMHAIITPAHNGEAYIEDEFSLGGTYVNGQDIRYKGKRRILRGATIRVGKTKLEIRDAEVLRPAPLQKQGHLSTGELPHLELYRLLYVASQSVGKVEVAQYQDGALGGIPTGTAWLLAENLAVTCWHVIEARDARAEPIQADDLALQVRNTRLIFDHTRPGVGEPYELSKLWPPSPELDYAIVQVKDREDRPIASRGYMPLGFGQPLNRSVRFVVLQHPQGEPQRLSDGALEDVRLRDGSFQELDSHFFYHDARTAGGTSGGPVLDFTNFRVVGIHRGERDRGGTVCGEAIAISAILSDLQVRQPDLYHRIMTAQQSIKKE
jgi:hypothetical protein